MYDTEIWENHNDLFGEENAELRNIAARVMGREMYKIAKRNKKLFDRLEGILNASTNAVANSKMAAIMAEYFENTVEENVVLLQEITKGFIENNGDRK